MDKIRQQQAASGGAPPSQCDPPPPPPPAVVLVPLAVAVQTAEKFPPLPTPLALGD